MLTADLVRARRKGTELTLSALKGKTRTRAVEISAQLIEVARAHVGATRDELDEGFRAVPVRSNERKLADGLRKLLEDRMDFGVQSDKDPRKLRAEVFKAATTARRALEGGESFDRAAFMQAQAESHKVDEETLERLLYADLKGAHRLQQIEPVQAAALVEHYDLSQQQAVLLRAVDLVADVRCADPYAYRVLFRKLKFHRLMHRIEARGDGGYRIHIDGPFSMFSASTKYGLSLALALPALLSCDEVTVRASLRWGKERTPLSFKIEGSSRPAGGATSAALPDEVQSFLDRFEKLNSGWDAEPSSDLLQVRGVGLCVPDVRFVHRETGEVAYLEVMGYWSRDAVFKRVEMVQAGLKERVVFAVTNRLRVSEELLGDEVPGELYVYKGAILPKEVLRRLDGDSQLSL